MTEETIEETGSAKRSRLEMETVIVFNEAERTAIIETFNPKIKKTLEEARKMSKDFRLVFKRGALYRYEVPKRYVSVRKPKTKKMSDEMRQAASERLKRGRRKKDELL